MKWSIKSFFLLPVFLLISSVDVTAQTISDMPEPRMEDEAPPPPGLVLPIDDYIPLLVIGGIFYGIYISRKLEKA